MNTDLNVDQLIEKLLSMKGYVLSYSAKNLALWSPSLKTTSKLLSHFAKTFSKSSQSSLNLKLLSLS